MGPEATYRTKRFFAMAAAVPRARVRLRRVLLEQRRRDKRCGAVATHVARRGVINFGMAPPVCPRHKHTAYRAQNLAVVLLKVRVAHRDAAKCPAALRAAVFRLLTPSTRGGEWH